MEQIIGCITFFGLLTIVSFLLVKSVKDLKKNNDDQKKKE